MTVLPLKIDFDSPAAERMAITQCAKFVRRRIGELQAAEVWISCGEHLAVLKKGLLKETPRGDNEHIGWQQAFQLEPREFPFTRRHADTLIKIYEFLMGTTVPVKKLPASVHALYLLTTKFKADLVEQCIADGSISPGSTEAEIAALGRKLKLIKPKVKPDPKSLPKRKRIEQVWELMARLGLTMEDLTRG